MYPLLLLPREFSPLFERKKERDRKNEWLLITVSNKKENSAMFLVMIIFGK